MVKCLDGAQRGDSEHILLSGIPHPGGISCL